MCDREILKKNPFSLFCSRQLKNTRKSEGTKPEKLECSRYGGHLNDGVVHGDKAKIKYKPP